MAFTAQRSGSGAPPPAPPARGTAQSEQLKKDVVADVESRRVFTQQMVDSIFSFSEVG